MYVPPKNDAIPMAMIIVMINPLNVDFFTIFSFFLILSKSSELKYSILKISVLIRIASFLKLLVLKIKRANDGI